MSEVALFFILLHSTNLYSVLYIQFYVSLKLLVQLFHCLYYPFVLPEARKLFIILTRAFQHHSNACIFIKAVLLVPLLLSFYLCVHIITAN